MINRNKGTHSYDKAVNIDNNKIISNFRKEHKLKIYTSPKMIKLTKEKNLEQKNINEIKKEPVEKNKIISSNFEQSKTAYNSPDKDEFELCLSKKNKNKINFSLKEDNNKFEEKKLMNLHTIKNKINAKNKDYFKNKFFYNTKYNNFVKENEKNNHNEDNKDINEYNIDSKNQESYNHSLMGFRHSNYVKFRKEREKNKGTYMSKRYNKNSEENNFWSQKEVKIYPSRNKKIPIINEKKYFNELFINNNQQNNNDSNNNNESQKYFTEDIDNEKELKKEDITGYRYKISNRYKKCEIKNKILSEKNPIKKQLLNTEFENKEKDLILKRTEINSTVESNYGTTIDKSINNNSKDYKFNSVDKYYSKYNEKKSKLLSNINNNNLDNKRKNCSFENSFQTQENINSPRTVYNNTNSNNNKNNSVNYNSCHTEDNIYNINNICIQNINQIPIKNRYKIKLNNLMDYKYSYYLNKKNKKLQKLKDVYNSKKRGDIDNLINDLLRIKNSKKKRFHRNDFNKTQEEIFN